MKYRVRFELYIFLNFESEKYKDNSVDICSFIEQRIMIFYGI